MSTYLVSRHAGTLEWFAKQGIHVDRHISHLDIDLINKGDCVVGTLPIQMVAEICNKGARYKHLEVVIPLEYRGVELTAEQLETFGATLTEFVAHKIDSSV